MTLLERIRTVLEFEENLSVGERETTGPTGVVLRNYSVNKGGIVLQFAIPKDENDEGVLEDFVEAIEAAVLELP